MTATTYHGDRALMSIPQPPEAIAEVQALVERARAGDGGAFANLYEQFEPQIYRYLLRRLGGNRTTAEDLTTEVFLKVLERWGGYEFRGVPFSAWLHRIARNHLIDYFRASPKRATSALDAGFTVTDAWAQLAMDRALDREELTPALRQLTSDQQAVVSLRFLSGLTTAETAAELCKSEDAIKKLQARGLAQLRRRLEWGRGIEITIERRGWS